MNTYMTTRDLSCNTICDSFLFNHTYKYSSTKLRNVVELNTNVGNCVSTSAAQTKGFKLPQPNTFNNINGVYRCEVQAWDPAEKAGQQQTMSTKMQQANRLTYIKKGGRYVYY